MNPLHQTFATTLQQEASMSTADKIITRLDAWGSQPAAPGTKRDPELAAILKDANALVEAPNQGGQCLCGSMTGRSSAKWCSACLRGMLNTQMLMRYGERYAYNRLGEFVVTKDKPAPQPRPQTEWAVVLPFSLAAGVAGAFAYCAILTLV